MSKSKQLSNAFSTGGGGAHFEAHVQASFVTLMLTGGYAPCLPCWPITEINLQGKIDGFDTDDLIVTVQKSGTRERRKLLGQVKHAISITQGSTLFGEVLQAAWNDFNNPEVFSKGKDIIALITGPLSKTDEHNVQWLLDQARHTKSVDEFFRNVEEANFSPSKSSEKLGVIRHHLKAANGDVDISRDDLYQFLNHFHLLGYDLGKEVGVILSLIHSHISQFQQQDPQWIWARVVDIAQTWNQDAGTITPQNLPEDIIEAFKQRAIVEIPNELTTNNEITITDWPHHPDATYLALVNLLGSWNENNESDIAVVTQMLGIGYDAWLQKAREILHRPDSPLSLKNGLWKISNRSELWGLLGSRILDQNIETFKEIALYVLKEPDPSFELPTEERYAASIHGKVLRHSRPLRKGISEGLAMFGSNPKACSNCSLTKAEGAAVLTIRELFTHADWVLWGSLNDLLPTLAEAAPNDFLDAVEKAMGLEPCPFDELFAQEGNGITGGNYLTGLLWALEGLAWDEQYLVRVCVVLGDLASHDPGGQSANRPSNSLTTILLPWYPQTLAPVEKRQVAVKTLSKEWPNIGWNLIKKLLPGRHQTTMGTHKPVWRKVIPEDWKEGATHQDYWEQISFYSELAVAAAGTTTDRLAELVGHFDKLPKPAFDKLIDTLSSPAITDLPEKQRLLIWDHLIKFAIRHRRYPDAKWALSDEPLTEIENVADLLAPASPFYLYQHLFTNREIDLYEETDSWEEQHKKLETRRQKAIEEIFQQGGIDSVIQFAESVISPGQVGHALGAMSDLSFEQTILPNFLNSPDKKLTDLVSGYIWKRHHVVGWNYWDEIDKSDWSPEQTGCLLSYLPFTNEAWARSQQWLDNQEDEYWTRTPANFYQFDGNLDIAIDNLIEHGRPHAAISCLNFLRYKKQQLSVEKCVRALLAALSSDEPSHAMGRHEILELIKFLQSEPSVTEEDIFSVEWAYLPLLDNDGEAAPQYLESRLANNPNFFCEIIQIAYRSNKEGTPKKETSSSSKNLAQNAWRLLHEWEVLPGVQSDGSFDGSQFNEWLEQVRAICTETGHLEIALLKFGEVLIHAPADPDGLWIHQAVAEVLNDPDAEDMRRGYRTGVYNARGAHWVDHTGKPEKELAEQYRHKAEEVENAGFQRFAITLRNLADGYERDAERVVAEHKDKQDSE